jgi:hypothetical protein
VRADFLKSIRRLYFRRWISRILPIMDKFWSIFAMPIGVALCFGPAVVVWWLTEGRKQSPDDKQEKQDK